MRNSGLLLFVVLVFVFTSCKKQEEGIKPEYRNLTEAVYSTVTVSPRHSYQVFAPVSGILETSSIHEGDKVKVGDILFEITNSQSKINIQNAKLKYEIAKNSYQGESAILKEISEQITNARIRVSNDSINYQRQKRLWSQDVGSKKDFESMELAYKISKNEVDRLVNSYERTQSDLKRQMEISKNTLSISKMNQQDFTVKSKLDGVVYSVNIEIGESVNPQSMLATIGSSDDYLLELLIDEVDISKIYLKQKVIISLDAFPDETFEAQLSKIYPEKNEQSLTFLVEAEFVTKPERLLKGLSGEANIVISERNDVLTLPSQFITSDNQVVTRDGNVRVTIGNKSLVYTEILSGIDSSTVVQMPE